MTGTALSKKKNFNIYMFDVAAVPTNKPVIRKDLHDVVFKTEKVKFMAVIKQLQECNAKGQPVLVGTVNVDKSEILSALLKRAGIKHEVLNAKYHAKEAEIVAQAGKKGAVTIATNMAGRATDINLGGNAEYMLNMKWHVKDLQMSLSQRQQVSVIQMMKILSMQEKYLPNLTTNSKHKSSRNKTKSASLAVCIL